MRTKIILLILNVACVVVTPVLSQAAPAKLEWEPIRPRDYWITSGLLTGAFLAYTQIEQQNGSLNHAKYIDDPGRSAFRFSSAGQRHDAEVLSNVALTLAIAWPLAVDPYLVWRGDGRARQAARVANINLQAFGLTAILTGTTSALLGRERLDVRDCRSNPSSDPRCTKNFSSEYSVYAFTGAGLTCLHHSELRIYGDSRDSWACGGAIGLAAVAAVARLAADKHFVTDVSNGALIGFLAGYVFPKWLHKSQPVSDASAKGPTVSHTPGIQSHWLPMLGEDGTYGLTHFIYF